MEELSWKTKRKGFWLFKKGNVKKDIETDKRDHFTVMNGEEDHQVTFEKTKDSWSCDCRFYSLKLTDCSHIIACKLFMREEE